MNNTRIHHRPSRDVVILEDKMNLKLASVQRVS